MRKTNIIFLIFITCILLINPISAQTNQNNIQEKNIQDSQIQITENSIFPISSILEKWKTSKGEKYNAAFLKYFILILFFAGIYSLMSFTDFPNTPPLRIILAIVSAILFTILIDPNKIVNILLLYKGVYTTIIIFLPILILGALTLKALEKFDTFGIFLQRILWGIYGGYLFFASLGLLLFSNNFLKGLNKIFPFNYLWNYLFKYIWKFYELFGLQEKNNAMGILLFASSILIIYFMSIKNDLSTKIIKDWLRDAKKMKEASKTKKINAVRNITAESIDNQ